MTITAGFRTCKPWTVGFQRRHATETLSILAPDTDAVFLSNYVCWFSLHLPSGNLT